MIFKRFIRKIWDGYCERAGLLPVVFPKRSAVRFLPCRPTIYFLPRSQRNIPCRLFLLCRFHKIPRALWFQIHSNLRSKLQQIIPQSVRRSSLFRRQLYLSGRNSLGAHDRQGRRNTDYYWRWSIVLPGSF